jgi:hypothetical protein
MRLHHRYGHQQQGGDVTVGEPIGDEAGDSAIGRGDGVPALPRPAALTARTPDHLDGFDDAERPARPKASGSAAARRSAIAAYVP